MGNYKEDTSQYFGTIFFIILFSLFILISFGKSETQNTASPGSLYQAELVPGNIPAGPDAIVFNAVNIPNLYTECLNALHNTSPDLFSLQYKISSYNHSTDQQFINMQKTRQVIEPLFLWKLYHPVSPGKNDDLPVLS